MNKEKESKWKFKPWTEEEVKKRDKEVKELLEKVNYNLRNKIYPGI